MSANTGSQAWKITKNARATFTEVMPLVYEGVNELAQEGYLVGKGLPFPVTGSDIAIFATSPDEDVIGVLCYQRVENEITITLAYVEHSSRKQGVFRSLWEALQDYEDQGHAILVRTVISVENRQAAQVCEAMGFVKGYAGWARLLQDAA